MEENKKCKQAINIIQDSSEDTKKQTQPIQPSPPPPPPPPPPRSTQSPSLPNASSPSPYRRPSPTMPTALAACPGLSSAGISSSSSVRSGPLSTSSSSCVPTPKHEAEPKKSKKMGHPVYQGAYEHNGKWISKIWGPAERTSIYLGTYPTPEMAARARDAAAMAMRGVSTELNFKDSARLLPRASSNSLDEIRRVASKAAEMFRPGAASAPSETPSMLVPTETVSSSVPMETPSSSAPTETPSSSAPMDTRLLSAPTETPLRMETPSTSAPTETPSSSAPMETPSSSALTETPLLWSPPMSMSAATQAPFVDEDELFNMPGILNDMAEGLMIPPLRRHAGSDDDDDDGTGDDHMDMPLWTN